MAALAALAAAAAVAARCNETKSKMKWSFIEFEVIGGFTRLVQGLRSMKCFGWKIFDNYFCFSSLNEIQFVFIRLKPNNVFGA